MLNHLLDLLSALADDLYCLNRLGIVNKRVGKKADEWSKCVCFLTSSYIHMLRQTVSSLTPLRCLRAAGVRRLARADSIVAFGY